MANEILLHNDDTPVVWTGDTQYAVGTYPANIYAQTHTLTFRGVADNTARQGDKADLGSRRPQGYLVKLGLMFAAAPTAGNPVEVYWSSSSSSHPASGNAGGGSPSNPYVSGVDGTFVPAGGAEADIDEYKRHLDFVGVFAAGNDANNQQVANINSYFSPSERYGQPVIKNDTGQALHAGGSGMFLAFIPVTDEIAS